VRVIVADDEVLLLEGVARLLSDAGFEVVGKAGDAEALVRLVDARRPDLVLTDIKMPPSHTEEGLEAAQEIRRRFRAPACSCSRTTSSPATPCGCWRSCPSAPAIC